MEYPVFKSISIIVILFTGSLAWSDSQSGKSGSNMNDEMAKELYDAKNPLLSLGKSYSFLEKDMKYQVRYCPDNTCEVILGPKSNGEVVAKDFAFLYFATTSKFSALQSFQKSVPPDDLKQVEKKYAPLCPEKNKNIKCILNKMKSKFSIELRFYRYDEKQEHFSEIDL